MANSQGPGFFDTHIEKVIFLLCVVVMLFAVVYYGLSTPLRLEVPSGPAGQTEEVAPTDVDSSILDSVKRIESVVQNAPAPEVPVMNDAALLKTQQQDFMQGVAMASVDFGAPMIAGMAQMGKKGGNTEPVSLQEIAEVIPAPAKPFNWTGIELRSLVTYDENGREQTGSLVEEPVWRGVDWYSISDLEKAWKKVLTNTIIIPQIVPIRCEIEFEELTADGKWQRVDDIRPFHLPVEASAEQMQQPPVIPDYIEAEDGMTNVEEVRQAIAELSSWMLEELQPDYYPIWSKEGQVPWQTHMPMEKITDLYKDFLSSGNTPSTVRPSSSSRTSRSKTTRRTAAPVMAPEMMMPGDMPPMAGTTSRNKTYTFRTTRRKTSSTTMAGQQEATIPDINTQFEAGKLLTWFHANNLKFGKKYRCRFRWIFVNPLLTYTKSVKPENIQDATTVKTVASPWSPWSDTIVVRRKMDFFLTGANDQRKEVTVTVFTEAMGQLVRARFNRIQAGQPIGGESEVSVVNPLSGEREKMTLNFQTGAIVVELDFNKRILTSFGRVKKDAVEMIYLDSEGNLCRRVRENDLLMPKYRAMLEEAQAGEPVVEKPVKEEKPTNTRRTPTKVVPIDMPPGAMPPGMPMGPGVPTRKR